MSTEVIYRSTEWLSFHQVVRLLETGELKIRSGGGSETELYITYLDRVHARELADKLKTKHQPEKEET
jgi:hypothetical protein